jgi:hypothetical protein
MSLHLFIYRRSAIYRRIHAEYVSFGIFRLNGFSRIEAAVSMLAHKVCGTPMYYYPKHRRDEMRRRRGVMKNG